MTNFQILIAILSALGGFGIISAISYGIVHSLHDISIRKDKEKEAYVKSFDELVAQLTSENRTAQLSAAILLRRYFNVGLEDLRIETINVISSFCVVIKVSTNVKTSI